MKEITKTNDLKAKLEKARIRVTGSSYAFFIPKALIDCKVLDGSVLYDVEIKAHKPDDALCGFCTQVIEPALVEGCWS